ncbi:MAG: tyrosine-type recombinase/integrase [Chloroflexi bacterium]|nr:tyrosine-type recombinase/integrase [Chloroflexota bacterium]
MSDIRQMPLFPTLPASEADLNPHTLLKHTVTLFQRHLLREGKTEHTVKSFTSDLQLLMEHGGDEMAIGSFNTTDLNGFLDWMEHGRGVSCSRKTYARRVTTLKVFFKWLREIEAIPHDPALAVLQRSGPAPLAEILSTDDISSVISHAASLRRGEKPDARPEMLFRLLLDTGIKKAETMRLTLEDVRRDHPPTVIVKHQSAKNVYKERIIELDPAWLPVLDEYIPQYKVQNLIITCTARNLEYILEDLGNGAGIDAKISFEMLRWTSAVRDFRADVDPNTIREKLGLSEISWYETFAKIKRLADEQVRQKA